MEFSQIKKDLEAMDVGAMIEDEPMYKHTTYKVGGPARIYLKVKDTESLIKTIEYCNENQVQYKVIGRGSNLLFSDKEYEGIIISLNECFTKISVNGCIVKAQSGVLMINLAYQAAKIGLSGFEFMGGIPGAIGGGIYMNAGAYKSDMGYIVKTVKVLTPDLKVITMVNREMDFHYRSSFLQKHKDYICLEAILKLKPGNREEMEELVKEGKKRRLESQPLEYPSAGSVFRNPEGDYAGRLIEELGYKGLIKGGAQVSVKHANFIINLGTATAADIRGLIEFIQDSVFEKYHISLKVEQEFVNWE